MNLEAIRLQFLSGEITKSAYIDLIYEQHNLLFDYATFIKNTNISSIEITDGEVVARFRDSGIRFICIPGDKRLAPLDTLNFLEYEKQELEMQYRLINPTSVVIDIGANLGWYSMHIAKNYPQCKLFAFEPIPRTFHYLNKNIQINQITNIFTFPIGLSDKQGEMDLFFDPLLSVNASLKNVAESPNIQKVTCKFDTLDNFCKRNKVGKIDFIKCDVEGAELFALKGSIELLTLFKPIVFCEMLRKWSKKFNYHPNDLISFMEKLGYICLVIRGNQLKTVLVIDDVTTDTNFIFLHQQNHEQQILALANN